MGLFSTITDAVTGITGGGIVNTIGAVSAITDLFDDTSPPSAVTAAGGNISAIAAALMNPDDPMFQKLVGQEEGIIARDYASALRDVGTANRRMMARTGGLGILDPERRDEALAGAFAKSQVDRKALAREQARAYLSGALNANQAVAGAYAPMIASDQLNRERRASGTQMLLDLGEKVFDQPQSQNITFDFNDFGFQAKPMNFDPNMISSYTTPMNFR